MIKPEEVRRLVTGDDEQGLSMVVEDKPAANIVRPIPGCQEAALINLWQTKTMPVQFSTLEDLSQLQIPLAPNKNGINFRFVNFPPDADYLHLVTQQEQRAQAWEKLSTNQNESLQKKSPHPLMHRTKTIDFGIVLSGEIYLVLDKEERLMREGDVVIQRGTNHAWSNRSSSLCRMAFILIDAEH